MANVTFGCLVDLLPREAWSHEAHSFTPWLASNIDHLAEAVGMPLEVTGTEMAVDAFAADILARNLADDTVVLIENQLEQSDHSHLGQIMTYLAGLEAHTIIWIAPKFRDPHLSAIRWLNTHTPEEFAFFAVRLRVVRIGESPYAPIFEVLERPNRWERQLQSAVKEAKEHESLIPQREAYWGQFDQEWPDNGTISRGRHRCFFFKEMPDLHLVLGIGRNRATIWVGSSAFNDTASFKGSFGSRLTEIEQILGAFGNSSKIRGFRQSIGCDLMDPATWPETLNWHRKQLNYYANSLETSMYQK